MNQNQLDGMLWGAFTADAYALGAHWVYDQEQIQHSAIEADVLNDPISSYHPNKHAGDFTHYGDQSLWLLESLGLCEEEYDFSDYSARWQTYMQHYKGYVDGASKTTLQNLQQGKDYHECGSNSSDFSVVGRMAPLFYFFHDEEAKFKDLALTLAHFTHASTSVEEATAFFAELMIALHDGRTLKSALKFVVNESGEYVQEIYNKALEQLSEPPLLAMQHLGLSCSCDGAFAGTLYMLMRYEHSYETALKLNMLSGGDSAARAMVIGMVLGFLHGIEVIPVTWRNALHTSSRIESLIQQHA